MGEPDQPQPPPPQITIPTIDISPYLADPASTSTNAALAASIRAAATSPGFFQITGHGVPPALRTRLLKSLESFFALPELTKAALHRNHSAAFRGWETVGDQMLEPGVVDRKEGFTIGAEWNSGEEATRSEKKEAGFLQGRNQWPGEEACPGFREVMMEYFGALKGLSLVMFRLMALSLGLDEGWFDEFVGSPDCECSAHECPKYDGKILNITLYHSRGHLQSSSLSAHDARCCLKSTRYRRSHRFWRPDAALTRQWYDDSRLPKNSPFFHFVLTTCAVGGLEVFHRPSQTWHPVQPVEDAFVVNIGDMMERWTNETYTSTLHRVISPVSDRYRYSVAFFNEGRLDQIVACIPTCLAAGEKPKYEPVQVEAHLKKRYGGSY